MTASSKVASASTVHDEISSSRVVVPSIIRPHYTNMCSSRNGDPPPAPRGAAGVFTTTTAGTYRVIVGVNDPFVTGYRLEVQSA